MSRLSFSFSTQAFRRGHISFKIKGEAAEEEVSPLLIPQKMNVVFIHPASCKDLCLPVDGIISLFIDLLQPHSTPMLLYAFRLN